MHSRRHLRRHLRRSTALALGAAIVAASTLTSCSATGRHVATSTVYTPAMGANNRDATVDVLGGVIVSSKDGSGTFIATLVNNDKVKANALGSLSSDTVKAASFEARPVPARGIANLANDEQGIPVTGEFTAGQFVEVSLGMHSGETVTMKVPVVLDDGDFDGLDLSA